MKVSVIVPVYNVETFLPYCVESLVNQNFEDYEILLIDDGSTDNSGEICDRFSKKYPVVKVFHKENGGLSDARNYGMLHAKGEYFVFVDSDDLVGRDYLKVLHNLVEEYNVDISVIDSVRIRNYDINNISKVIDDNTTLSSSEKILSKEDALKSMLVRKDLGVSAWGKMYKRSLFDNISYPKGKIYEDMLTTPYLIDSMQSQSLAVSNAIQYLYFVREDSITQKKFSNRDLTIFDGLDKCDTFLRERYSGMEEPLQCRYLTDVIGICNRIVFTENYKEILSSVMGRDKNMWNGYLLNKYLWNRTKMQIFVLKFSPMLYKLIIKIVLQKR